MFAVDTGDSGGSTGGYEVVGVINTFRVNQNNTTTPLVELTGRSTTYDVTYTFDVTRERFMADGADAIVNGKNAEVETICAHPHVQAFRTEKEENRSSLLYNYAVITVGNDDSSITTDVSVRMDQINTPGAFSIIDHAYSKLGL